MRTAKREDPHIQVILAAAESAEVEREAPPVVVEEPDWPLLSDPELESEVGSLSSEPEVGEEPLAELRWTLKVDAVDVGVVLIVAEAATQ